MFIHTYIILALAKHGTSVHLYESHTILSGVLNLGVGERSHKRKAIYACTDRGFVVVDVISSVADAIIVCVCAVVAAPIIASCPLSQIIEGKALPEELIDSAKSVKKLLWYKVVEISMGKFSCSLTATLLFVKLFSVIVLNIGQASVEVIMVLTEENTICSAWKCRPL
jgi:hypothetical protein